MADKLKVTLDMDDLTFGEMEDFEKVTGLVMSDAVKTVNVLDADGRPVPDPDDPKGRPLKESKMSAKAMMGMVYLGLRKENPDITFDDVRKLKLSEVDFDMTEGIEDTKGKAPESERESSSSDKSETDASE
jgi:hypothetical protein